MPPNINNNYHSTIFVDLDGTLVEHNYNPDEQEERFLPGALTFLLKMEEKGYHIILTTARSQENCQKFLELMASYGFVFHDCLFNLPTGPRIIINDNKPDSKEPYKAVALNVERNRGLEQLLDGILERNEIF